MLRDIPAIRILPMSDKRKGFRGRSIADVQRAVFLRDLPTKGGRFRYPVSGLNARAGTVVLFQYQARTIACAIFLRDEKFDRRRSGYGGILHFEAASFKTFEPMGAEAMRKIWPGFRAFGHVKQYLNPTLYPKFKRRMKRLEKPLTS